MECYLRGAFFAVGEAPYEPNPVIDVDIPEMVTKFMESHDDPDIGSEMRSLSEFSLGSVMLCSGCFMRC
jgi:hypothetical protein